MQSINRIGTPVVNSLHRKGYPVPIGHTSIYLRTKVYLVNCCNLKKVFEAKRSPQKNETVCDFVGFHWFCTLSS